MRADVADEAQARIALPRPVMSPASSPESPTAYEPWRFTDATISRFTLPTSAMRTMSTVSASVTRSPSTNSGSLPRRRMSSLICGPPPCTTTGFMPTRCISTTSCAKRSASAGSSMAWPPYLMTTVRPENSRMYGQRLGEDRGLLMRVACDSTSLVRDGVDGRASARPHVLVDVARG